MMKVQYIDRHTMTVKCDGIEYPIFDSNISIEDMQTIVDETEKIVNGIIESYEYGREVS